MCVVGIRSAFRLTQAASAISSSLGLPGAGAVMASPWSTGQLSQVVWADILGDAAELPVLRAEAMTVPPVVKARQILVAQLADLPLVALDAAGVVAAQPAWLTRTDGAMTPWHRMAWTLDDILFSGWSLWAVERLDGEIVNALRVSIDDWRFAPDGSVECYGTTATADEVILIPGPAEGLLEYARRTIRAARNIESAWAGRIRNPIPAVELHQMTDDVLTEPEIRSFIDTYCAARMDVNGAVVYTPNAIELRAHGESSADMLIEGRNAVRLDVANYTGLPGAALDGSLSTASLTYSTQEGRSSELGDALRLWMSPIAARLSQDDVVPPGQRVRFDTGERLTPTPNPTGPIVKD